MSDEKKSDVYDHMSDNEKFQNFVWMMEDVDFTNEIAHKLRRIANQENCLVKYENTIADLEKELKIQGKKSFHDGQKNGLNAAIGLISIAKETETFPTQANFADIQATQVFQEVRKLVVERDAYNRAAMKIANDLHIQNEELKRAKNAEKERDEARLKLKDTENLLSEQRFLARQQSEAIKELSMQLRVTQAAWDRDRRAGFVPSKPENEAHSDVETIHTLQHDDMGNLIVSETPSNPETPEPWLKPNEPILSVVKFWCHKCGHEGHTSAECPND